MSQSMLHYHTLCTESHSHAHPARSHSHTVALSLVRSHSVTVYTVAVTVTQSLWTQSLYHTVNAVKVTVWSVTACYCAHSRSRTAT